MKVCMERMCGCGRAYGGGLSLYLGLQIEQWNKKKRENNELALGVCHFIFRLNNQLIVGASNGRYDGEDVRLGWSVWGVLFLFSGRHIEQQKNTNVTHQSTPRRVTLPMTTTSTPLATMGKTSSLLRATMAMTHPLPPPTSTSPSRTTSTSRMPRAKTTTSTPSAEQWQSKCNIE